MIPKKYFTIPRLLRCFVLAALSLTAEYQTAKADDFSLVWSSQFGTPLSVNQWNIYNNTNFASSANTCFQGTNAYTKDNFLYLAINTSQNQCNLKYTASGLDTHNSQIRNYGKWEVRAKFPKAYGTTGYIGLFVDDSSIWPPEIDFAEVTGKEPQKLYLTQHYGLKTKPQEAGIAFTQPGVDWTADYHTFTLEWVPGRFSYYVDGVLRLTQSQRFAAIPQKMKLAIGTGTGNCGSWVDCPENAPANLTDRSLPASLSVEYVKIYQYNPLSPKP